MGLRRGLSADDTARPPGAAQGPFVSSVPFVSMAEVSCPSPNNALAGGSEWTRPNGGVGSLYESRARSTNKKKP